MYIVHAVRDVLSTIADRCTLLVRRSGVRLSSKSVW